MVSETMVERGSGLIEAEVDGEIVALHVENGRCYGFNSTATVIWKMIETPKSLDTIRDALVGQFDVDPQTCEAQLKDLLDELAKDGLIEIRPAAG